MKLNPGKKYAIMLFIGSGLAVFSFILFLFQLSHLMSEDNSSYFSTPFLRYLFNSSSPLFTAVFFIVISVLTLKGKAFGLVMNTSVLAAALFFMISVEPLTILNSIFPFIRSEIMYVSYQTSSVFAALLSSAANILILIACFSFYLKLGNLRQKETPSDKIQVTPLVSGLIFWGSVLNFPKSSSISYLILRFKSVVSAYPNRELTSYYQDKANDELWRLIFSEVLPHFLLIIAPIAFLILFIFIMRGFRYGLRFNTAILIFSIIYTIYMITVLFSSLPSLFTEISVLAIIYSVLSLTANVLEYMSLPILLIISSVLSYINFFKFKNKPVEQQS